MATLQPGEKSRMYALGGVARGGAVRGGYVDGRVYLSHGGQQIGWARTNPAVGTILESLQVSDMLDEQPNTCRYRVNGAVPSNGDAVILTMGSQNSLKRLFAGHALTVQQLYAADNPKNLQADVVAVDHTWLLGNLLITKAYHAQLATAIAIDLVAAAAGDGFSSAGVAANLPWLEEITYTNESLTEALTRLARRIGAYWYCDYHKVIHLFYTEPQRPDPEALTPAHTSLAHFTREQDRTQTLTRVYVEGRGSTIVGGVGVGETQIPVTSVDMFEPASDVFLKASLQGASGGAQHLSFTGVIEGGGGGLVGMGTKPTAAPTLALQTGGSVNAGEHHYAVTFVTASGESLSSPVATVTTGAVPNPTGAVINFYNMPSSAPASGGFIPIGDTLRVGYSYSTATASADWQSATTEIFQHATTLVTIQNSDPLNPTNSAPINAGFPMSPDPRVKWVNTWLWQASRNGWGPYHIFANNPDAGPGYYWNEQFRTNIVPLTLPTNTTATQTVVISDLAVGPSAVTQRKLYRSRANMGTSQLFLLGTIPDKTTTTYTDTATDATLGVAVPTTDTSGLQQQTGQVSPGSSSIPIAGGGAFPATGGWAVIGNGVQVIRYAQRLTVDVPPGEHLTGIPKTGFGAITAAISYNSTITAANVITGIPASGPRSIRTPLTQGDELYLVVQVDDTTRQNDLAADVGGTGIREEWVQDRRLSIPEARARGQATLAIRPLDQERIHYTCRDLRTASGASITVNLPAPTNVTGTYKIQQVTISNFRPHATQYPTFMVDASSSRFSFEDWLRVMRTKE
jgi:hypothetical protein